MSERGAGASNSNRREVPSVYSATDSEESAIPDFDELKRKPIVDCAAFQELNRTEEFKNLLAFLDSIEIDEDQQSFSYIKKPAQNESEEFKKETSKSETDSTSDNDLFTRHRSYSNKFVVKNSHSSNDLDSCFMSDEPKSISLTSSIEQLISVIPPTDPKVLELIDHDSNKIVTINGTPKEIRFYGKTAITFMNAFDPREVTYLGAPVNIIIDDTFSFMCFYNKPDTGLILDNQLHKIHLGAPTRELYIDDNYYSCSVNGPPIRCVLNNVKRCIKLIGDAPSIVIGDTVRQDLVAGISYIIVDSFHPVIVYLDAKPQCIDVGQSKLILRFVDKLMSVLINNQYFKVDFDGDPLEIYVQGRLHFLKFSKLLPCIQPGFTNISDMLNIVRTEYTTNYTSIISSPSKKKNSSKSSVDVQKCNEGISIDSSPDSRSSLTTLQSLQSDLVLQLNKNKKVKKKCTSSKITFPLQNTVSPNNVNTIDTLLTKSDNDNHQLNDLSLYDLWDTELEITYGNYAQSEKRKMSTPEPDILRKSSKKYKKKKHRHTKKERKHKKTKKSQDI